MVAKIAYAAVCSGYVWHNCCADEQARKERNLA